MDNQITQFRRWLVLPQYKHVIYITPKVANRSIVIFFNKLYGSSSRITNPAQSIHKWLTYDEVQELCPDWPKIVTVRNPIDRVLGVYNYHVLGSGLTKDGSLQKIGLVRNMALSSYIQVVKENITGNSHWSPVHLACPNPDMVIRFENLEQDWSEYCRMYLESPPTKLEHVGWTQRRVNPETRNRISISLVGSFKTELEVFGYDHRASL